MDAELEDWADDPNYYPEEAGRCLFSFFVILSHSRHTGSITANIDTDNTGHKKRAALIIVMT